eukprot:gene1091-2646_t
MPLRLAHLPASRPARAARCPGASVNPNMCPTYALLPLGPSPSCLTPPWPHATPGTLAPYLAPDDRLDPGRGCACRCKEGLSRPRFCPDVLDYVEEHWTRPATGADAPLAMDKDMRPLSVRKAGDASHTVVDGKCTVCFNEGPPFKHYCSILYRPKPGTVPQPAHLPDFVRLPSKACFSQELQDGTEPFNQKEWFGLLAPGHPLLPTEQWPKKLKEDPPKPASSAEAQASTGLLPGKAAGDAPPQPAESTA